MERVTTEEEIELAARIKQGDEQAREQLIQANLRLVVKIARDYEHVGLPLLDLINEGNIGLMKAVERFDPAKGAKFSTYGAFWIKQGIKRALANQTRTIRVPVHMVDKIYHMRIAAHRLSELFGREPTDEELGEEMGLSPKKIGLDELLPRLLVALLDPRGQFDFLFRRDPLHPSDLLQVEAQRALPFRILHAQRLSHFDRLPDQIRVVEGHWQPDAANAWRILRIKLTTVAA